MLKEAAYHDWFVANTMRVLILVLMEHAQRVWPLPLVWALVSSLNPCFNGTCSKSNSVGSIGMCQYVLILVLMEHAQRAVPLITFIAIYLVLILVLMEHAQRGYAGEPLLPLQVS